MWRSILFIVSALVACVILGGTAIAQPTAAGPTTRLVPVDGHVIRVQFSGLDKRKNGSPVVVFEAGATHSLDAWGDIPLKIATTAPVVAYDRAGLGQSEWDQETPSPLHVSNRLRKLLTEIGAEPPFVLVGYSWGGNLARYFAGYFPDDVAGLVYVDPGPIVTQSLEEQLASFHAVGAGQEGFDAFWSGYTALFERASPAVRAEFDVFRGLMARDATERDLKPVPDVPVVVVIAAKPYPAFLELPYDHAAHFESDLRQRIKSLQEWALASTRGTIIVSNHYSHAVLREDPRVVVWATERVLANALRGR